MNLNRNVCCLGGGINSISLHFRIKIISWFPFYRQEFPYYWLWRGLRSWVNILCLWRVTWCSHLYSDGSVPYDDFGRHHPRRSGFHFFFSPSQGISSEISLCWFSLSKALHFYRRTNSGESTWHHLNLSLAFVVKGDVKNCHSNRTFLIHGIYHSWTLSSGHMMQPIISPLPSNDFPLVLKSLILVGVVMLMLFII